MQTCSEMCKSQAVECIFRPYKVQGIKLLNVLATIICKNVAVTRPMGRYTPIWEILLTERAKKQNQTSFVKQEGSQSASGVHYQSILCVSCFTHLFLTFPGIKYPPKPTSDRKRLFWLIVQGCNPSPWILLFTVKALKCCQNQLPY